jgi:hypothetical protein
MGLKYGHALSEMIFISSAANEWKDVSETEQAIFVTSLTYKRPAIAVAVIRKVYLWYFHT